MADPIKPQTRKRLWTKADDECAFTGCSQALLEPNEANTHDTLVGWECHIVAKSDDPRVARSPSSLSEAERSRWARLIEDRHAEANIIVMCPTHGSLIDDPAAGFTVDDIVEMKRLHEESVRERRRSSAPGGVREGATVVHQPLLLEDIPAWQRRATAALAKSDPAALAWLHEQIGQPTEPARVKALITRWPRELLDGPRDLALLLVREAEALALWEWAARAGERIAALAEGTERADHLTRAGIDAGVAGEPERRERLLAEAEALDPDCVRLRLVRIDQSAEGPAQLAALEGLTSEDQGLAAMIECQRSLAHLRSEDLDAAAAAIEAAQQLDQDSIGVRIARVNLGLQRGRLAVLDDRAFVTADLLNVHDQALELRDSLVEMGRWDESVRVLMMASDARSLLRDLDGAAALLEQARPEEVAADEGAAVLGDAALRAGAPALALRFVDAIEPDEILRRIAASAHAELGGSGRSLALLELEEMALAGGPEAEAAAVSRLILCMPPAWAKWNDEVAAILQGGPFERHVTVMRILCLAPDEPERALQLASELPRKSWAAELRLRVAGIAGDKDRTAAAAKEFLGFSPDAAGRLLAAQGLAQAEEIERAGEIALGVARDPNTPAHVRSDGFHIAMKTLADRNEWRLANEVWEEWRDFAFKELKASEGRVSAWQVRVIHNRPRPIAANGSLTGTPKRERRDSNPRPPA